MTDYFGLLGEARRPWIDPERLKQKFLALSTESHPDRLHEAGLDQKQEAQERYTELNAAFQCLREPKDRLRHLVELERGAKPEQLHRIPPDLMDFALAVGEACRRADALLAEHSRTTSPLLRVGLFERAQEETLKLKALQEQLEVRRSALLSQVQALDGRWSAEDHAGMLAELESLYRLLSYCERSAGQLRERIAQLSFVDLQPPSG
jgi:hypothetical protein